MLLEFTVENYLSIKKPITLSMIASKDNDNLCNVINPDELAKGKGILKSAVVYGANASGKTNLIKAMDFMRDFIIEKAKNILPTDKINVTPFKFDEETPQKPSRFEVTFIQEGIKYFYGFSLDKGKIHQEYLYHYPKSRQAVVFERSNTVEYKNEDKKLAASTPKNKLYLITLAQNNDETAIKVLEWFKNTMIFVNHRSLVKFTFEKFGENKNYAKQIINFINNIDVGIKDIFIEETDISEKDLPENMSEQLKKRILSEKSGKKIKVETMHEIIQKNGTKKDYPLEIQFESRGTRKIFEMIGLLIDVIEKNEIFIIDELEQSFHPELTTQIIELFHSQNSKAQLIFTTHDSSQLNIKNFRKDQIYITKKNRDEQYTDLYSLHDIKGIRTDNLQKEYLQGKYGGIPFIDIEGLKWQKNS